MLLVQCQLENLNPLPPFSSLFFQTEYMDNAGLITFSHVILAKMSLKILLQSEIGEQLILIILHVMTHVSKPKPKLQLCSFLSLER